MLPRVGFLGLGWIGRLRLQALAEAGLVRIVALADADAEAVRAASTYAPDAVQVRALDDLLQLDLDGVVIATPSARHSTLR